MKMIFVNLPVSDVAKATAFYQAIGFELNPMFSNEQASAMGWSEAINVMLLDRAFYSTFTTKAIADTHATSAALLCLSFDSRAAVDAVTEAAIAAGGRETRDRQDMGFMYSRAFEDLDGHVFEPMFMDMAVAAQTMGQPEPAPEPAPEPTHAS
jgi:predicted lactoylglutathione lyase